MSERDRGDLCRRYADFRLGLNDPFCSLSKWFRFKHKQERIYSGTLGAKGYGLTPVDFLFKLKLYSVKRSNISERVLQLL